MFLEASKTWRWGNCLRRGIFGRLISIGLCLRAPDPGRIWYFLSEFKSMLRGNHTLASLSHRSLSFQGSLIYLRIRLLFGNIGIRESRLKHDHVALMYPS